MAECVKLIEFIESNVDHAVQLKGLLTLTECRQFLLSIGNLKQKFTDSRATEKIDYQSISFIKDCCEALQKTGVFSMKGAMDLLNAIDTIEAALKQ